ncbi:hypothetical protein NCS56_00574200 [Fusarium sp. Ph1]|nr:hypothetical protein NCS56_00574200 [Fusarium sp. Ph1]
MAEPHQATAVVCPAANLVTGPGPVPSPSFGRLGWPALTWGDTRLGLIYSTPCFSLSLSRVQDDRGQYPTGPWEPTELGSSPQEISSISPMRTRINKGARSFVRRLEMTSFPPSAYRHHFSSSCDMNVGITYYTQPLGASRSRFNLIIGTQPRAPFSHTFQHMCLSRRRVMN